MDKAKVGMNSESVDDQEGFQEDVDNQLSNYPDMWGEISGRSGPRRVVLPSGEMKPRRHTIIDYISVPSLYYSFTWPVSTVQWSFHTWPIQTPGLGVLATGQNDRITWMSRFFRYWRGGVRYTFVFLMSPLMSCRIAASVEWNSLTSTDIVTSPDLMKRVVTMRGTTVMSFDIPFVSQTPWNPCSDWSQSGYADPLGANTAMMPFINLRFLQGFQTLGDVTPAMHVYVFKKALPDFKFYSLRQAYITYQGEGDPSEDCIQGQMLVSKICSSGEAPQMGNSCPDPGRRGATYIEEIGSRFAVVATSETLLDSYYTMPFTPNVATATLETANNIECLSGMFMYYRGSYDWKIGLDDEEVAQMVVVTADNGCNVDGLDNSTPIDPELVSANGQVRVDPKYTSVVDFRATVQGVLDWWPTIPDAVDTFPSAHYTGSMAWDTRGIVNYHMTDQDGSPVAPVSYLMRMGRDCSFAYLVPPPNSTYWPNIVVESPMPGLMTAYQKRKIVRKKNKEIRVNARVRNGTRVLPQPEVNQRKSSRKVKLFGL